MPLDDVSCIRLRGISSQMLNYQTFIMRKSMTEKTRMILRENLPSSVLERKSSPRRCFVRNIGMGQNTELVGPLTAWDAHLAKESCQVCPDHFVSLDPADFASRVDDFCYNRDFLHIKQRSKSLGLQIRSYKTTVKFWALSLVFVLRVHWILNYSQILHSS